MAETSPKSVAAEVAVTDEQPQIADVPVDKAKLLVSPVKPHCDQEGKPCETASTSNGEGHQNGTEKTETMETGNNHKEGTCEKIEQPCSREETTVTSDVATSPPSEALISGEQNGGENQTTGNTAEQITCESHTEVPENMVESPKTCTSGETDAAENGTMKEGCPSTTSPSTTEGPGTTGSPKPAGEKDGQEMEQEAAVDVHEKMVESPKAAASSECSAL